MKNVMIINSISIVEHYIHPVLKFGIHFLLKYKEQIAQ